MPLIWVALTTLGSAFVGSFLAAYLKKKGENLATHEDIDKLVDQIEATKKIEARIADDYWGRQKRWELQREIVLEALDRIAELQGESTKLTAATIAGRGVTDPGKRAEVGEYVRSTAFGLIEKVPKLMSISYKLALVTGREVQQTFCKVHQLLLSVEPHLRNDDVQAAIDAVSAIELATHEVLAAIRNELGFPSLDAMPSIIVGN